MCVKMHTLQIQIYVVRYLLVSCLWESSGN